MAEYKQPRLSIQVLGALRIELDGEPISGLPSRKAEALLVYLVCHQRTFSREFLANLLWDDRPQDQALANLRSVLSSLRRALGPFLTITRQRVGFNRAGDFWLDLTAFTGFLEDCGSHPHVALEACAACMERLERAVAIYKGPFLDGFSVTESSGFEEWSLLMHERSQRQALDALGLLCAFYTRQGRYRQARAYARRQVELEPFREEAHRQLMLALARSGQRTAALAQYETCRRILNDELGVEPNAETRGLYQRIRSAGQSSLHNLPPQLTPLVGREEELQEIAGHLADPGRRLLTLTGPGGIGKTLLALQAAREHVGLYMHGVYFVPLSTLEDSARLGITIADAVSCPLDGVAPVDVQLLDFLREKDMLLVLDNFEHLLAASSWVGRLLQSAAHVQVLITSRERLHLRGEHVLHVHGLAYPEASTPVDTGAEAFTAVRLFMIAARRVDPDYTPSPSDMAVIFDICRRLEGLPLAIELAAPWVRLVDSREILRQLERGLDFLSASRYDAPGGRESMRLAFARSWDLLAPEEQAALSRLSVFRGSFDATDAQEVAGADLYMLMALADKSLLQQAANRRFALHRLLKQYLSEKLAAHPAAEMAARDAHARQLARFLQERESWLQDVRQAQAMAEIALVLEDIRAAWQWATERHLMEVIDQAAESVYLFFWARNRFAEGKTMFSQALDALATKTPTTESEIRRARLHIRRAEMMYWLGEHHAGEAAVKESITVFRRHQAKRELALALELLGRLWVAQGAYPAARQLYQESLTIARQIGAKREYAQALSNLASIHCMETADYATAREMYAASMEVYEEIGDQYGIAKVIINLGALEHEEGNLEEAKMCYDRSLQIYRSLEYRYGISAALAYLGDWAQAADDPRAARALLEESLALSRESGNRNATVEALIGLARANIRLESYRDARHCLTEALEAGIAIQAPQLVLGALNEYARLFLAAGQKQQAIDVLDFVLHYPLQAEELKGQTRKLLQAIHGDAGWKRADHTGHGQALSLAASVEQVLNTPLNLPAASLSG